MRPPRCDKCRRYASPHFCHPRAQRVRRIFEQILVHTKTRQWARKPFLLEEWQFDEILGPLFGWVEWSEEHAAWLRVYRVLWFELGRKNGKSEILAGIALVLMVGDDEDGAEVYGCALDVPQARKVFDVAERMVELSPLLSKRITSYKQNRRLLDARTGSYYEVIPADAPGALGQNPHGIVFDELEVQPDRALWDALRTGFGSRMQPMLIAAGTAGDTQSGFAYEEHQYSERVAANPAIDRRRLVFMRNTPMDADPWDESNWLHANPALSGKRPFLSISTLRDEAKEAREQPAKEHSFRQFRLNQWQQAGTRAIPSLVWDLCIGGAGAGTSRDELDERAIRQRAFGGLDLSATTDLTALCWLFPDLGNFAVWRYWLPEAMIEPLDRLTDSAISAWVKQGWITATSGAVIEYDDVYKQIDADRTRFNVVDLNYDRWSAAPIIQALETRGLTAVQVTQGYALNAPIRELLKWLKAKQFAHGGNPVTRWNAMSLEVKEDHFERYELVKPRRGASGARIDGMAALINAVDGVMRRGNVPQKSRKAVGW